VNAASFKFDGSSSAAVSTPSLATHATGSTIVVCIGRGILSAHAPPTDNKGNTYTQIGVRHAYSIWPTSGTACYAAVSAIGGSGHVITAPVLGSSPNDENTMSVIEIVGGSRIQDAAWNEDASSPLTTGNVTTTGPATLIAVWWGSGLEDHVATPDNGFTVLHSVLQNGPLVQMAAATKAVSGAGTYNVSWASREGAQLWLIAVQ
jgi:hypothetical protein